MANWASYAGSSDTLCLISPKASWGLTIHFLLYPVYPRVYWFGAQGGVLRVYEGGKQRAKLSVALDGCGEGASDVPEDLTREIQLEVHTQGAGKAKGEQAEREDLDWRWTGKMPVLLVYPHLLLR